MVSGTIITNAQPNITSVGTLCNLQIDCSASEIDAVAINGASHGLYLSTDTNGVSLVTGTAQSGTGLYFLPNDQQLGIVTDSNVLSVFTRQGHFTPYTDGTINLGDPGARWKNSYLTDVHIKNNLGDWTMVAGADGLYLYNNSTNSAYKINMTPVTLNVPPKIGY